jgi:hypothetical protein
MKFEDLKVGMVLHGINYPYEMLFIVKWLTAESSSLIQHVFSLQVGGLREYKITPKLIELWEWGAENRIYANTQIAKSDELEMFLQMLFQVDVIKHIY